MKNFTKLIMNSKYFPLKTIELDYALRCCASGDGFLRLEPEPRILTDAQFSGLYVYSLDICYPELRLENVVDFPDRILVFQAKQIHHHLGVFNITHISISQIESTVLKDLLGTFPKIPNLSSVVIYILLGCAPLSGKILIWPSIPLLNHPSFSAPKNVQLIANTKEIYSANIAKLTEIQEQINTFEYVDYYCEALFDFGKSPSFFSIILVSKFNKIYRQSIFAEGVKSP